MIVLETFGGGERRKVEVQGEGSITGYAPEGDTIVAGMMSAGVLWLIDNEPHTKQELLDLSIQCGFDLGVTMSNTKTEIETALRAALA